MHRKMTVLSQSLVLVLPVIVSTEWVLGGSGESCIQACSAKGLSCSSKALHEHNSEFNSEREVAALIGSFNETCTSYNLDYGSNSDVPAYRKSNGECYVSDISRQEATFNCERTASVGKHRLCWCHSAATSTEVVGCGQIAIDNSTGISTSAIIWIISGNMLALGLVCMCCGVLHRLMKKWRGQPEEPNLSIRPEDPGIFVRCPACGCPLERTHTTGTTTFSRVTTRARSRQEAINDARSQAQSQSSLGDESHSHRTCQTVAFRDEVSEVSYSQAVAPIADELV